MTCTDCPHPAIHDGHAGWVPLGDNWHAMTRPLCDDCAREWAREKAEAVSS